MGINRFGTRMRSYATKCTLGSTSSPAKNSTAIIDGPGLAHHIYYKLCIEIARPIRYSDCAAGVLRWLDNLRSIGFEIEAIFFDGALPTSKKDVRIQRLQGYVDRVQNFKRAFGSGVPVLRGATRKTLPPIPFLVFAVVEGLLESSRYAEATWLVPGEADPYCVGASELVAQTSPDKKITIFSDDADLLVYQLDERTNVAPFRDLAEAEVEGDMVWTGEVYWSAQIAGRAAPKPLENLIQAAFFMSLDPHCTLDAAMRMQLDATSSDRSPNDFIVFAQEFDTRSVVSEWKKLKSSSKRKESLAPRDSRVSELIWQCSSTSSGGLRMYLPFILDDPTRASAWNAGAELRTLAYSLLLRHSSLDDTIQEYRRSGARMASVSVESFASASVEQQAEELTAYIERISAWAAEEGKLDETDVWRYMVIQNTLQYLEAAGYALPTIGEILRVISNREDPIWQSIHLSAQFQATYYSFRILKQILAHIVATEDSASETSIMVAKLHERLGNLPRIATLFGENQAEQVNHWQGLLKDTITTLVGEEEVQQPKRRKKSKKNKSKNSEAEEQPLAKNPFAMLADD